MGKNTVDTVTGQNARVGGNLNLLYTGYVAKYKDTQVHARIDVFLLFSFFFSTLRQESPVTQAGL